jgi:cell wall-associated NlpC family hydrolase
MQWPWVHGGTLPHQRNPGARCVHLASRASTAALAALLIAGCASAPKQPEDGPPTGAWPDTTADMLNPVRAQVVFTALQMVGVPYRWGGQGPEGFDCSGLVLYSYNNAGLTMPRTSREQFRATTPIRLDQITPGDLVFFNTSEDASHVGIYVGEGRFVHAPASNRTVRLERLDNSYYRQRFLRGGRLPGN